MKRPEICAKRGCYIKPKALFPKWDALNIRCSECPYVEIKEKTNDQNDQSTA